MKRILGTIVLAAVLALCSTLALAEGFPNLVGTWKMDTTEAFNKESTTTSFGEANYFTGFVSVFTIDKQEGPLFSGSIATPKKNVSLAGVIDPNGTSLYMVDNQGIYICTLIPKAAKDTPSGSLADMGRVVPSPAYDKMIVRYLAPGEPKKIAGIASFMRSK